MPSDRAQSPLKPWLAIVLALGGAVGLVAWLTLSALSLGVTSEFSSVEAARQAGLERKGWLPVEVPSTGLRLREFHNLDTNQVFGMLTHQGGVEAVPFEPCAGLQISPAPFDDWPAALTGSVTGSRLADAGFVLALGSGAMGTHFGIAHNRTTGQLVYWAPLGCEPGDAR